ncbi:MAG: FTR1 family protein [Anaerolineae bacterium]
MRKLLFTFCLCCLLLVSAVHAQSDTTPQAAGETLRQTLFEAQSALISGDSAQAAADVQQAYDLYQANFSSTFDAPVLDDAFDSALLAAQESDSLRLAVARAAIWTEILNYNTQFVFDALQNGDVETARAWLNLREYRASTRFSRPGADATLALTNPNLSNEERLEAVQADLLDTYQAQLNKALADADDANQRDFAMRRAEESSLAAGYFGILASAYGAQRGTDALTSAQQAFALLVNAALADDDSTYLAARTQIDAVLQGFRAAPLSAAEQARRAGQLTRFLSLVPVEYARGVVNGEVIHDIEIQEAQTFLDGANAAFADLQPTLAGLDAEAAAHAAELLSSVQTQIDTAADPNSLQSTIDEISGIFNALFPDEWRNVNTDSDVDVVLSVLEQVSAAAQQGEYTLAESSRLEAYALLELGIEQRLRGFAPEQAAYIESLFWQGTEQQPGLSTLIAEQASANQISTAVSILSSALSDAQAVINASRSAPQAVAGNAAVIVFREGLEAVLILASLLASLRTVEERAYRRPLVMGAALAFVASVVTWVVAQMLLTALLPLGERLEAIVSLIAIGVLLLITNWFFHKVYWTGWMANFHAKKRQIIGGVVVVSISQTVGLVILGFTSIYREGFETVLFLQSLVLEAGIGIVLEGVVLGLIGVAIVGYITFALQVRLPYKKMLIVTGIMIGFVLLTMVGNTVHVMQSVGWLPISSIQGLFIPYWMGQWFGLFATWQGIGLQVLAGAFVIGSYFLAEHQNSGKRRVGERQTASA